MIDIAGVELDAVERARIAHPLVGGVILFARNYASPEQLCRLTADVRAVRPVLIAADHEGGRVQRFREGFTRLPPMATLGRLYDHDQDAARDAARHLGYLIAVELRSAGIDLSFAPVLDLDYGVSTVIGDRAFHTTADGVVDLAGAFVAGLHLGGLGACGKHFPGHGYIAADSHDEVPVDTRDFARLEADLQPFLKVPLDAVMPAHVIFPAVDDHPAGFSRRWIGLLKGRYGFGGLLFSDDLSMAGAGVVGEAPARVEAAWQAGCDMLLLCNAPDQVDRVLRDWRPSTRHLPVRSVDGIRALPLGSAAKRCCRAGDYYRSAVRLAGELCAAAGIA
jgi:beta-N-acetylhexosaminidase